MALRVIDGLILKNMLICGANKLIQNSKELDALNVFPVPDGDTGINMAHTVQAAAMECKKINSPNVYDVAKAASNGALRGARGNSGVILSQLYRGFAKGLKDKSVANAPDLATALFESAEMAYRAVMKPKEGTILSVARAVGERPNTEREISADIEKGLEWVIKTARIALEKTPDQLPELKQAGVVDSGGKGLLYFFEGALEGLKMERGEEASLTGRQSQKNNATAASSVKTEDIKFAYCTEFLVESKTDVPEDQLAALKTYLNDIGDSVVTVCDETIIKIHVHTNNPGKALERGLKLGQLDSIKIENMKVQHTNLIEFSSQTDFDNSETPKTPKKPVAFVTIATGEGFISLFKDIGADIVIEGGQTMNPSAEEIAKAIENAPSDTVFVLPNNKNIILAAEQATKLIKNKTVNVLQTRSTPQGVAALLEYHGKECAETFLEDARQKIETVHSGHITRAVRDTTVGDLVIKTGQNIALFNGELIMAADDSETLAQDLAAHMFKNLKTCEFAAVYYGEGKSKESAEALKEYITNLQEGLECEVVNGGQPLYDYIISFEEN